MLKGKRLVIKNVSGDTIGYDYSDCEPYDIAPKTYEGRTIHNLVDLDKTRRLAIQLLITQGATPEDASRRFHYGVRTIYRILEDGDVPVKGTGEDFEKVVNRCIKIMSSCDYTIADLAAIWDMCESKVNKVLNV